MTLTVRNAAFAIFIVCTLTIIGAWVFEWAGYAPCPLCLMQRWPYYAAIPLSAAVAALASSGKAWPRYGLAVLALILIGSGLFGAYHAGIEWDFWPGPTTCAGDIPRGLPTLSNEPVIGCDDAAIRILGLSLAGWNAVISFCLAAIAIAGATRRTYGSSSVSQ